MENDWKIITAGHVLPLDFVINGVLNRDKYIIEYGFLQHKKWYDEFLSPVSAEIIGAIIIGSDAYNDFRYRLRQNNDQKWCLSKTNIGKIFNSCRNDSFSMF